MHTTLSALRIAVALLLAFKIATLADSPKALTTSPKGTYRIERENVSGEETPTDASGDREWVVSTRDATKRALLPKKNGDQLYDLMFSPDEKWIAANVHYGSKMAGFRLFRNKDGVQFEFALDEEPARKWLDNSQEDIPIMADMYRHAGWSFDSARLLLRSPIGGEEIKRGTPTAECFYYHNTRSGKTETTNYLRDLNRDAVRILRSEKPDRLITRAQAAEPVDEPPAVESSRARYEASDAQLNKVYTKLMEKVKPDDKTFLRNWQREWIKLRDAGAEAFAAAQPKTKRPSYQQLYLADATESRVRDLEDWMQRFAE